MGYDIIGDVHGHADALVELLKKLGYSQRAGAWRHSDRRVIFLGDFIDRGPQQREVLELARAMLDAGSALAVMGNHELNAIAWATADRLDPSKRLRDHSEKNRSQHGKFLAAVGEGSALHQEYIRWFRRLPLWLEVDGIRIVHATWRSSEMAKLQEHVARGNLLTDDLLQEGSKPGGVFYNALEVTLKGLEIPLPEGRSFFDKDGHVRESVRVNGGRPRPEPTEARCWKFQRRLQIG